MPRNTISSCESNGSPLPLRRSARLQQRQKPPIQGPANPARRGRPSVKPGADPQCKVKKKRNNGDLGKEKDCDVPAAQKVNTNSSQENEATRPTRRGVRFDNDQPLEPLPNVEADEETVARAAAAAVTVQSLATRPENAQYATLDPRVFPCPPDSRARFAPTRTLDSKGRVLLQYSIRYILAYRIEVGALYTYLKSVKRDFHDFQGTLLYFQLRLDEELDMRHSQGMSEMVYMGERVWTMVMSQSDCPETLPYPTARIQKFQEIMGCKCEPLIYPFRPRAHRL